jgi:hypothetical protein
LGGLLFLIVASFSFLSLAQPAPPSQPGDFRVRSVRAQLVLAPQISQALGQGATGAALQKKWLRIETTFDSKPEWADDVTCKYYVLVGKGREAKLFTGEATYVNVNRGAGHISAVFMHPNTVERYGQGRVEAVAVELLHQGRKMDDASEPASGARWWERYTPMPGYLLTPQQTPWSISAYERYEQIKPTGRTD